MGFPFLPKLPNEIKWIERDSKFYRYRLYSNNFWWVLVTIYFTNDMTAEISRTCKWLSKVRRVWLIWESLFLLKTLVLHLQTDVTTGSHWFELPIEWVTSVFTYSLSDDRARDLLDAHPCALWKGKILTLFSYNEFIHICGQSYVFPPRERVTI